jgi:hypothetical protein
MKITLPAQARHRNGVAGQAFEVALFHERGSAATSPSLYSVGTR